MTYNRVIEEYGVSIYYGCDRISEETLSNDAVNDHVFWFAHAPVSTRDLRLKGYIGADWEYIVNFDLEPLTGRLTAAAALPAYDSVDAWYNYYNSYELRILTVDFKVESPSLVSDLDIWGQPHYTVHANYPSDVNFKLVLRSEPQRNWLTESTLRSCYFLLIDKGIPETYGIRAYEGPIWSSEQASLYKGASPFLPIKLMVQQFGLYSLETGDTILSVTNAGAGYVNLWTNNILSAYGDLDIGDWITVTGTTNYNGTWQIHDLIDMDPNYAIQVKIAYVTSQTGAWVRDENIRWGYWSASS